jgi:hypothetical protein
MIKKLSFLKADIEAFEILIAVFDKKENKS